MRLRILIFVWALCTTAVTNAQTPDTTTSYPKLFAHRGCWNKVIPENTPDAVRMAARMGYEGIELDARWTADSVLVVFHDRRINKKLRHASDYSKIAEPTLLASLTFEQLRNEYVLASPNKTMRQPVATLDDMLQACKECGMIPMLHSNIPASYQQAQALFGNDWICFTADYERILEVRTYSDCLVLYSLREEIPLDELFTRLERIGGRVGISTMTTAMLTPEFCHALTSRGYEVQASIFRAPAEMVAQRNGITYQLTDFSMMPNPQRTPQYRWTLRQAQTLSPETPITQSWEAVECGALTLEIAYEGEVTVTLNGKRTYPLSGRGVEHIGTRLFGQSPTLHITTNGKGKVLRAEALVYCF
ncbi:MAG: hypothetical protein J6R73_04820 [Alistipes sp.]|nr:hypothetical protein [Alistipes sp.]